MINDYNQVKGLTQQEFDKATAPPPGLVYPTKYVETTQAEIGHIENLLDVKPGTLAGSKYEFEDYVCKSCGRQLSTYDFVSTGIVDAGHSKSFILHTLVGNKNVVNTPRITKCTNCGTKSEAPCSYRMSGGGSSYSCSTALTARTA